MGHRSLGALRDADTHFFGWGCGQKWKCDPAEAPKSSPLLGTVQAEYGGYLPKGVWPLPRRNVGGMTDAHVTQGKGAALGATGGTFWWLARLREIFWYGVH